MPLSLDRTEKSIITVGLCVSLLLSGAAFIWSDTIKERFSKQANGTFIAETVDESAPAVTPATEQMQSESIASITVEDTGSGTADIYMDLSDATKITGAELYFGVDGDVLGASITCTETFSCPGNEVTNSQIAIYAFRLINEVNNELSGKVKIATMTYDPLSNLTLTINDTRVNETLVTALGTTQNLMSPEVRSFTLGD